MEEKWETEKHNVIHWIEQRVVSLRSLVFSLPMRIYPSRNERNEGNQKEGGGREWIDEFSRETVKPKDLICLRRYTARRRLEEDCLRPGEPIFEDFFQPVRSKLDPAVIRLKKIEENRNSDSCDLEERTNERDRDRLGNFPREIPRINISSMISENRNNRRWKNRNGFRVSLLDYSRVYSCMRIESRLEFEVHKGRR